MNYQQGGWYDNPATGRNQQFWNGQWYDTPQQNGGSAQTSNPLDLYNQYSKQLSDNLNNYINQQQGFYQTSHDLTAGNLNAQNTQALGTQSDAAKSAFLNSVNDPLQQQEGAIQYGYGLNQGHENATYGLNTTANSQNRQLALDKLANDEKWAMQGVDLNQSKDNAATIDSLNSRGLLYGQQPTGGYNPMAMGGMTGVAGQTAGLVNTGYANQRGQLTSGYGLNQQGINQDYNQQQNMLNENHGYATKENAFNATNDINSQNNAYKLQTGMNDNQLAMYKANLANQKAQQDIQNKITAQSIGARQGGIVY